MKTLAKHIVDRLAVKSYCIVFETELARIWSRKLPVDKRKEEIRRFAQEHGLFATISDPGLRVIFRKAV